MASLEGEIDFPADANGQKAGRLERRLETRVHFSNVKCVPARPANILNTRRTNFAAYLDRPKGAKVAARRRQLIVEELCTAARIALRERLSGARFAAL